ncbi:hypothetical protein [Sansalvadorimonas verongulae]|uniref:hypothetical protein n=1 Tax=Sansalvadorimonas verongulae TaxID=2172824 RepID=UPI0012BBAC83|nr:hypothetical protein [Sansalvadorimonas verongulae]MTI15462.1 hypothetical protein [Sansalvadorimonas verongulae]
MSDLQQAIDLETVDTLKKRYFTYFGVKPKQIRKAFLIEALREGLSDPILLKPYLKKLPKLEMIFIRESVFHYNGHIEKPRFEAKYGEFPEGTRKNGLLYFYGAGLSESVEPFFYPQGDRYGSPKIPDGLLSILQSLIDPPEPDMLKSCTLPDPLPDHYKVFQRERLAPSELQSLLVLLQDKQIKVSDKTGVASLATLKKVSQDTHEYYEKTSCDEAKGMDLMVSYGWLRLLENSKFSKCSKTTLLLAENTGKNSAETVKEIWEQWVTRSSDDEFRRINTIKGQTGKGKRFFSDVKGRRQEIITYLKGCRVGAWYAFEDFSKFMFTTGSKLEITAEPDYLYIYDSSYGEFYNAPWDLLEARYIRCFLVEYAATLGLIDVVMAPPNSDNCYYDDFGDMECLSRYDGLRFFRLTSLGAYALDLSGSYQATEAESTETTLTIQRQGRVVFEQTPTPWEQRFLSLYADNIKENTWKLSRKKISEVIQVGGSIDELRTFLLMRENQPFLPEDCESLLKQAEANRDAVKLHSEALVMTCKTPEIADLIVNDKVLSKWCQRLGKLQVVIPKNKEKKFRDSLNAMGVGCS